MPKKMTITAAFDSADSRAAREAAESAERLITALSRGIGSFRWPAGLAQVMGQHVFWAAEAMPPPKAYHDQDWDEARGLAARLIAVARACATAGVAMATADPEGRHSGEVREGGDPLDGEIVVVTPGGVTVTLRLNLGGRACHWQAEVDFGRESQNLFSDLVAAASAAGLEWEKEG